MVLEGLALGESPVIAPATYTSLFVGVGAERGLTVGCTWWRHMHTPFAGYLAFSEDGMSTRALRSLCGPGGFPEGLHS